MTGRHRNKAPSPSTNRPAGRYRNRGRILSCSRVLDGGTILATVHYSYDELGRLVGKTVGDVNFPMLETGITYDLHGWTTGIDVAVAEGVGSGMDLIFSETLSYADTLKDPSACRFDGNISGTAFTHRIFTDGNGQPDSYLQTNTWSYAYDGLKRLTDANHYPGAAQTPSLTDTERDIAYDLNGNITFLKRYGNTGLENDLSFNHDGNRMTALSDANAMGTDAGTKSFTYDVNGNMTSNGRKGLELTWNVLNLVDSAAMHGSSLKYAWLSDGTKVSAKADDGSGNGVQKRYLGSFVLTSNTEHCADEATEVESIAWDEGRIFFDVPVAVDDPFDPFTFPGEMEPVMDSVVVDSTSVIFGYRDCWFAGDHLGNVRSVIDITEDLGFPQVLEQSNYLPYGTRIQDQYFASAMADNRWRYAGKEEQDFTPFSTLNLSLLDFGARMYDPFIARWTAGDPLASAYYSITPFSYCASNPISFQDPEGKAIETVWDVASLAIGVKSFVSNVKQGKVGAAILDGVGIAADALAVATPFVPGGVGAGIKAARAGDNAVDAVKTANHAIDGIKAKSNLSGLKNAERVAEGRQFEKDAMAMTRASGADAVSGVRVVPQNGKGNIPGNRSTVDQLVRDKNGSFQIVESKLTPKSGLSPGQKATSEHVIKGSGTMEVRSNVPEFNLSPGDIINVDQYKVIYKYP